MDERESRGSQIGTSVSRFLLAAVEALSWPGRLLKRSQYLLALPRRTCSCTVPYITPLLLQYYYSEINIGWFEGARFWTHPIQRTQELHQDESCIF